MLLLVGPGKRHNRKASTNFGQLILALVVWGLFGAWSVNPINTKPSGWSRVNLGLMS